MPTAEARVTPKQQRFVGEYLIDLNATQAAIRAGYGEAGAAVRGAELVRNRKVAAAIRDAVDARAARTAITADWVLARQRALYEVAKDENGETARKILRDIGEAIGMYVNRTEDVSKLTQEERDERANALFERVMKRRSGLQIV